MAQRRGAGAVQARHPVVGASALILHGMARSSPSSSFRQRLLAYRWRRVGILAASSLALSLALVLYLFGVSDYFFGRLFNAFFVSFWLLAATFLGIIPFIGWAATHWFGRGWQAEVIPGKRVAPKPTAGRPVATTSTARRSSAS